MNEIIKGMANASEAIQENFEEQGERLETVEQNIELLDFSDSLTTKTGVTDLTALKVGRLHMITFAYKPDETGFTIGVITGVPAEYRPNTFIAGSVATSLAQTDADRGVATYLSTSGIVSISVTTLPSNAMRFHFTWIA